MASQHQYSEIGEHYCVVQEPKKGSSYESKLDELLLRVRRIDATVLKHIGDNSPKIAKPKVPPKPNADRNPALPVTFSYPSFSSHNDPVSPPPRPPKGNVRVRSQTEKIFKRTECDFLSAQLQSIRTFIDQMIDDDFEGKRENVLAIDSVITALSFH